MTGTFENSDVQRAVYELASLAGVISDADDVPREYAWRLKGPETFALTENGSFALPILLTLLDKAEEELSYVSPEEKESVSSLRKFHGMTVLEPDDSELNFPALQALANFIYYRPPVNDMSSIIAPKSAEMDELDYTDRVIAHAFWKHFPNMCVSDGRTKHRIEHDLQHYLVTVVTSLTYAPYHDNLSHYIGVHQRAVSWGENIAYAKPLLAAAWKLQQQATGD